MRESLKKARARLSQEDTHRGLWLDRYLESTDREDKEAKRKLVQEAVRIREPKEYAAFFRRYQEALQEVGAQTCKAQTRGRLVVGLGGEGVLETGLTLHRTYGVPYIPGSALKGLASRYAHLHLEGEVWRRNLREFRRGEAQAVLFGTPEEEGAVVFFDALPLPGKWSLQEDILNPHHPEYYGGEDTPPADWDSPVPVPFLSVTGTFLVALAPAPGFSPPPGLMEAAWRILAWALKEEGVGGKTSSGYGRMALEEGCAGGSAGGKAQAAFSPEYEALRTRVRSLRYLELGSFLKSEAQRILALRPEELEGLKKALEERKFLNNPRDLRDMAKKDPTVKQVLERMGLL